MSGHGGTKAARGKGSNPKRSLDNSKSEDTLEEEDEGVPVVKKVNRGGGGGGKKGGRKGAAAAEEVEKSRGEDEEEDDEEDEVVVGEEEEDEDEEEDEEDEEEDDEEEEEDGSDASEESNPDQPPREFGPRSFVVLKTDFDQEGSDPPLWRIDGNSLLQKFTPFKEKDGTLLYKSTSVYSGWSVNNKESYYAAPVVFQRHDKNDFIVRFERDQVKKEPTKEEEN